MQCAAKKKRRQVNEKSLGGRQDRDEWMHVAMVMTFEL